MSRHPREWEPIATWANAMTLVRTAIAVPLGVYALVEASTALLVVAYGTYWIGDMADGWLARRFDQETRIGAVLDIVSDRACCGVLVCVLAVIHPDMWPALAVFLLQFMVLDCVLSLSFLRWSLVSPNYFYRVDLTVWRYNWSSPAKTVNTVAVVIAVVSGLMPVAMAIAIAQLTVKVWSTHRVLSLDLNREPDADHPIDQTSSTQTSSTQTTNATQTLQTTQTDLTAVLDRTRTADD
jgi:phosphatidylglycerophosphate synthase